MTKKAKGHGGVSAKSHSAVRGTGGLMIEDGKILGKFIGTIEHHDYGWRASFRMLEPGAVFSQHGDSRVFGKEAEAMKWLHTQAGSLGFSSIDIRRK
jgi:hypothetical protein